MQQEDQQQTNTLHKYLPSNNSNHEKLMQLTVIAVVEGSRLQRINFEMLCVTFARSKDINIIIATTYTVG